MATDEMQDLDDQLDEDDLDDEEDEDDACPVGDPDCLSRDGECHDACEAPTESAAGEVDRSIPDTWDVRLNSFERRVVRLALTAHADELVKLQKKTRQRTGAPNADVDEQLRAINGDDGWGQGLLSKMVSYQRGLDDEAARAAAERRDVESLVGLLSLVAEPALPVDVVAAWSADERREASEWAAAVAAKVGGSDVAVPERPSCVTQALEAVSAFQPDPELPFDEPPVRVSENGARELQTAAAQG